MDQVNLFKKAAVVAAHPMDFEEMDELSQEDKDGLRIEMTNKWRQPKTMWLLVVCCSMAAVVREYDFVS